MPDLWKGCVVVTESYDQIKNDILSTIQGMLKGLKDDQRAGDPVNHQLIRSLNSTLKTLVDLTKAEATLRQGISGRVSGANRGSAVFGAENLEEQAAALTAQVAKTSIGRT